MSSLKALLLTAAAVPVAASIDLLVVGDWGELRNAAPLDYQNNYQVTCLMVSLQVGSLSPHTLLLLSALWLKAWA